PGPCRRPARGGWCWTGSTTPAAGRSSCGGRRTAGGRRGPGRRAGAGRGSVIAPHEPDQTALHLHLVGAEDARLIGPVGGLQRDRTALLSQPLEGGFLTLDEGHDDLAGGGR